MTGNMQVEDVLNILGRVGTVTLRKGTNDTSATPGARADTEGWICELQVAGYLVPYGHGGLGGYQLRFDGRAEGETSKPRGLTALEAVTRTLDELTLYLASDRAAEHRENYLNNGRHGDRVAPEARIVWGD